MRIVEVNSICGKGSTGRIAMQIAQLLRESGDDAIVAYGRDKTSYPHAYRIGGTLSNQLHGVLTRIGDAHGYGSRLATKRFVRFLRKFKPDVVHLHNTHGYYLNDKVLFSYLKKANIPVIWTLHDCWAFTGHCTYFDLVKCERWKTGCKQCQQTREYPTSWLADRSCGNYARKKRLYTGLQNMTVVTPSAWLADLVRESFLGKYPVKVFYNGIDLSCFAPCDYSAVEQKYGLSGKKIVLGVASGFGDRKGLQDFIKLADNLPDTYRVVLVGCDPQECIEHPKMRMIQRTESVQELAMFYSMAHAFVNLTYEDNFPTVNLEALACGTPVITYRTGGSPEAVDDTCGFVVEQGDLEQVITILRQLETEPIDSRACTERAKQYDKDRCFREYVELIHRIGQQNGSGGGTV